MVGELSGSPRPARIRGAVALGMAAALLVAGCESPAPFYRSGSGRTDGPVVGLGGPAPYVSVTPPPTGTLAMPEKPRPPGAGRDIYAATRRGMLTALTRRYPPRVYVPNSGSGTVDVIDQRTFQIVRRLRIGGRPLNVIPSWDLRKLWVGDRAGLVPIDPLTGRRGPAVRAAAPYSMYFTAGGRGALAMADRLVAFRDPRSMRPRGRLRVPCRGPGRADYTADQASLVAGCGLSGLVIRLDPVRREVTGVLRLGRRSMPRDVRLSPDGTVFYVADAARRGVWLIDAARFRRVGFVPTGSGAQGLFPSRDAGVLYVTNRGAGTIALLDFATRRVIGRWPLPPGAVDGGVSADGQVLWLSAPQRDAVYALSTRTGKLLRTIKVGRAPRGLCVHPQPGRYSLGHTGLYR